VKNVRTQSVATTAKPVSRKHTARYQPAQLARESKGLVLAARSCAAKIAAFQVIDSAAADLAGRWRLEIDAQERKVVEWFAPAKHAAFKAHTAICRQENDALAPYREARRVINAKLSGWQAKQEQQLVAGQPRRRGEACPTEPGAPLDAQSPSHVAGVSFRENWRVEVIDKVAFVGAIAARPELVNLVDPNLSALGHLARAHKGALNLPGVRVWREWSVAASRRP
jgi:hypothetical protein